MRVTRWYLLAGSILFTAVAGGGHAAAGQAAGGSIGQLCLAPFHVPGAAPGEPPPIGGPNLSDTTWAPQHDSHFRFYVEGRLRATVADGESAYLQGLPTTKPIRVRVELDERPFESFSLDLAKAADHRICLWLYPGYWHWIDNGWDAQLGCKCGETPAPPATPMKDGG